MRVRRSRKTLAADASYSELFFFDEHYALSALYCQEVKYSFTTAIPRIVGSVCPQQEEDRGEPHAAYKFMLFSRARCPGPNHCADPFAFRSLLHHREATIRSLLASLQMRDGAEGGLGCGSGEALSNDRRPC